MQNAYIITRDGDTKSVKNLGWLLRNWKDVESFIVNPPTNPHPYAFDCYVTAIMRPQSRVERYVTPFASKSVLRDWLDRPVFRGLPIEWNV